MLVLLAERADTRNYTGERLPSVRTPPPDVSNQIVVLSNSESVVFKFSKLLLIMFIIFVAISVVLGEKSLKP